VDNFSVINYIAPPEFVLKIMQVPFRSIVVTGGMGSGKTTWVRNKIGEACQYLFNQGVDDDEILVLHVTEMPLASVLNVIDDLANEFDFNRIRYFYLFNDDAPAAEGQISRTHQRQLNIKTSKQYIMIRHILSREYNFYGALIVFHATQVYHLLDITFRRTARLHLFKDYPTEPMDRKIIGMTLGRGYMRQLLKITLQSTIPRNQNELIEGLSSAVALLSGRIKFVAVADPYPLPRHYHFYPGSEFKESYIRSASRFPNITLREFSYILRKHGIKAREQKMLRAYRELMFTMGFDVSRKDYGDEDEE
jgi:hypothetical protein